MTLFKSTEITASQIPSDLVWDDTPHTFYSEDGRVFSITDTGACGLSESAYEIVLDLRPCRPAFYLDSVGMKGSTAYFLYRPDPDSTTLETPIYRSISGLPEDYTYQERSTAVATLLKEQPERFHPLPTACVKYINDGPAVLTDSELEIILQLEGVERTGIMSDICAKILQEQSKHSAELVKQAAEFWQRQLTTPFMQSAQAILAESEEP